MRRRRGAWTALAAGVTALLAGCARPPETVLPVSGGHLPIDAIVPEDTTPKANLRMVPPEAYMRTYLNLFGALSPADTQKVARGNEGAALFDTWDDYVSSLGFPDYRTDIPRQTQTNTLMVATFERLGVALCDRALEHDLKVRPMPPVDTRLIFAFDPTAPGKTDRAAFAPRFDVLHRTFLGYPARLASKEREGRFFQLFTETVAAHAQEKGTRFTPDEAGWAAVCYGLVRHPEFNLY
jgi:hypothetical protein